MSDKTTKPYKLTVEVQESVGLEECPVAIMVNGIWLASKTVSVQLPYDTEPKEAIDYITALINTNINFVPNFNDAGYQENANTVNHVVKANAINALNEQLDKITNGICDDCFSKVILREIVIVPDSFFTVTYKIEPHV